MPETDENARRYAGEVDAWVAGGQTGPVPVLYVSDDSPVDDVFEVGARPNPLAMDAFDKPRRFLLNRSADPSGVTGVGAVAWGCLWPSGRVSLDWQLEHQMRGGYYDSIEDVLHLHGHATSVEWLDV